MTLRGNPWAQLYHMKEVGLWGLAARAAGISEDLHAGLSRGSHIGVVEIVQLN